MRTGKERSEGQAFHRRLLSEYNTEITLDNYVSYFELKPIVKDVEQLRKKIEQTQAASSDASTAAASASNGAAAAQDDKAACNALKVKEMMEKRHVLEVEFFKQLHASFVKVKNYLLGLESDLLSRVKELKQLTEEEIRARPEQYIPKLYVRVQSILQYRALNLAAYRKIMKKFMERCACDSLELQKRLLTVDGIIYRSALSQPRLDLRRVALDLIALYGTVYRLTYEGTVDRLSRYEHRTGVNNRRILPHSETFFFTLNFPHQERQGDFAVRILPGNTSLFCEKMICEVLQCERYPPCCSQFPNGEVNVVLSRTLRGDDVFVLQSLVKCDRLGLSHSGTLMELALMLHAAKLSAAARITAVIPYLSYTGSVSSMAVVAELLERMGCQHVITVDMACEQMEGMFSVPLEMISARYEFVRYIANHLTNEGNDFGKITIVAPTGASVNRAKHFADDLMCYKKLSRSEQLVSLCTAVHRQASLPPMPIVSPHSGDCHSFAPGGVVNDSASTCESSIYAEFDRKMDAEVAEHTCTPHSHSPQSTLTSPVCQNNSHGRGNKKSRQTHQQRPHSLVSPSYGYSPVTNGTSNTYAFEQALRRQDEGICAIRNVPMDNPTVTEGLALVGDVRDRLCIIFDTSIDEGIEICRTAWKLHEEGASRIILIATHFIISGGAVDRLIQSPIDLIVVTDSVDQDDVFRNPRIAQKLRVLPIAPLLARAIEKVHTENSLTTLFEK